MPESYSVIYPGNFVNHLSTWGKPNAAFRAANRGTGDPRDRQHQAALVRPGLLAVQKVGFLHVEGAAPGGASIQGNGLTIASPDARADDKPRSDINGLIVPSGAHLYRIGLRIPRAANQPGYYSSGAKDAVANEYTGLRSGNNSRLWLEAGAAAPTVVPTAGAITATGAKSAPIAAGATGAYTADAKSTTLLTPVTTTAELTFRIYTETGGIGSDFLGGVYVLAEVCYLVEDGVADLSYISAVEGARVAGYSG